MFNKPPINDFIPAWLDLPSGNDHPTSIGWLNTRPHSAVGRRSSQRVDQRILHNEEFPRLNSSSTNNLNQQQQHQHHIGALPLRRAGVSMTPPPTLGGTAQRRHGWGPSPPPLLFAPPPPPQQTPTPPTANSNNNNTAPLATNRMYKATLPRNLTARRVLASKPPTPNNNNNSPHQVSPNSLRSTSTTNLDRSQLQQHEDNELNGNNDTARLQLHQQTTLPKDVCSYDSIDKHRQTASCAKSVVLHLWQFNEEERLLRAMGWREDGDEGPLTPEEITEAKTTTSKATHSAPTTKVSGAVGCRRLVGWVSAPPSRTPVAASDLKKALLATMGVRSDTEDTERSGHSDSSESDD